MQTDRGIYHKRVCDRCGYRLDGKAYAIMVEDLQQALENAEDVHNGEH